MSAATAFPESNTESVAIPVGDGIPFPSEAPSVPSPSYPPTTSVDSNVVKKEVVEEETTEGYNLSTVPYNEKSFKLVGNSKPFRFSLRKMGGSWNRNLDGGAGWIFSVKHQDEVEDFVVKVNAGDVEPDQVQPRGKKYYNKNKAHTVGGISLPGMQVNGPNQGYGDPRMQTLTYTVFRPNVGMSAKIKEGTAQMTYPVTRVGSSHNNGMIDEAYITWNNGAGQMVTKLVIENGRWQVKGKATNHAVIFI